jgi:hypothetical protein
MGFFAIVNLSPLIGVVREAFPKKKMINSKMSENNNIERLVEKNYCKNYNVPLCM